MCWDSGVIQRGWIVMILTKEYTYIRNMMDDGQLKYHSTKWVAEKDEGYLLAATVISLLHASRTWKSFRYSKIDSKWLLSTFDKICGGPSVTEWRESNTGCNKMINAAVHWIHLILTAFFAWVEDGIEPLIYWTWKVKFTFRQLRKQSYKFFTFPKCFSFMPHAVIRTKCE